MSKDLLPAFRFILTLDKADAYLPPSQAALLPEIAPGDFQEGKGLGAELEVMTYAEGGVNDFVHQLPVRHSWNRLVLKRGIVRDPILWQWYQIGLSQSLGARRDGSVILLDHQGKRVMAWEFRGGIAAKWIGPEFSAMDNAIVVESLEIAHQGLNLAGGTFDIGEAVEAVIGVFS
ncbi:phage tail protein [Sedimenticola selenatireducens]|uniref:Phage tail protein n=1 Tax=Sedimenticola selenatireducens TaxID=191960 RepID=A0A2N6CT18_9GAMM|nr:phage tail protein [Sedimenticola selenatireducens]PLX60263.1 MAG: phage tail protein [Sedimenticola selenatireducens]